jgi:hypothetical protein
MPTPTLRHADDAIVRPIAAARCDLDNAFLLRDVSAAVRIGLALHILDPLVKDTMGVPPFEGPFPYGENAEARGVLLPRWSITVFAVPRTFRHAIKTALLSDGLPNLLRTWLAENAELTSKVRGSAINLEYDGC